MLIIMHKALDPIWIMDHHDALYDQAFNISFHEKVEPL